MVDCNIMSCHGLREEVNGDDDCPSFNPNSSASSSSSSVDTVGEVWIELTV